MAWTVSASGTVTPVVGTPSTLATDTTNATYQLFVDANALPAQVILELAVFTTVLSGGTSRQVWFGSFPGGQLVSPIIESPFVASDVELHVTLNQLSGVAAAFPWKLLRQ